MQQHTIHIEKVMLGYEKRFLVQPFSAQIKQGNLYAIVGENGSGKSTLLKTIMGIQQPQSGNILIDEQLVGNLSPLEKAKKIAYVSTKSIVPYEMSVYEMVAAGRSPYTSWTGKINSADKIIVEKSLVITGIEHFKDRKVDTLSDGERQKVFIARAIAQQTPFILFDEPASFLDYSNKVELMALFRKLAEEENKGIIFSIHDLDLAIYSSDYLWAIHDNVMNCNHPESLILEGVFERFFKNNKLCFNPENGKFEYLIHSPHKDRPAILLTGEQQALYWTKNYLNKKGYQVESQTELTNATVVNVTKEGNKYLWTINNKIQSDSLADLSNQLKQIARLYDD
jgi:iron complex transport system ATP-binding protein